MTRYARILVKKFWGLCAFLLIACAVLVQLGRELSPLVGNYREAYSRYLSEMLGVDVSIDQLSAHWSGLRPQLQLRGLRMKNSAGTPILSVIDARAELSLLRSLVEWRLSWGQLSFSSIEMGFVQGPDGKWNLSGLPKTTAGGNATDRDPLDSGVTIDDPLDVFLFGRYVELQDAHLKFQFRTGHETSVQVPLILLENSPDFHRLTTRLVVDEQVDDEFAENSHQNPGNKYAGSDEANEFAHEPVDVLQFVLEGEGDPRDMDSFQSRGYLQLRDFPLEKLMAALPGERWKNLPDGKWRDGHTLDLQLWLSSTKNAGFSFQGDVRIDGVPLELSSEMTLPQQLTADLSGYWMPEGGWQVGMQNAALSWDGNRSPAFNLAISDTTAAGPVVSSNRLELAPWLQLANKYGFLNGKLKDTLDTLDPRGTLHDLQLQMKYTGGEPDFRLRANLEQVAVNAWKGAPALVGVNGYVEAGRDGGFVEIDSSAGFMMHYDTIYEQPMRYESMSGHIAWQLRPDDNAIYVNSGPLRLRNESEIVDGYFHIYLPWQKGSAASNLVLQIGLQNSRASNHTKYVPSTVAESLRDWLSKSLGQGDISDGGFIYNGSLAKSNPAGRTMQMYLDIHDASLDYHADWPGLTNIDGVLTMDDRELNVRVEKARLYESEVEPTLVALAPNPMGQGLLLGINGSVKGSAKDGLRVLRESKLRETIGDSLDSWSIAGDLRTELILSIPLDADEPGMQQQVQVHFSDARLAMEKLQLQFEQLQGQVNYTSAAGLNTDNLAGRLWQKPVKISILSQANQTAGRDTLISMNGSVDVKDLAQWSSRPELLFATGNINYLAQLFLPAAKDSAPGAAVPGAAVGPAGARPVDTSEDGNYTALLNVSSDLKGVAIELPPPYGKSTQESRPLQVQVPIAEDHLLYDIRYADLIHALFLSREGQLQSASIALATNAVLPQQRAIHIGGKPQKLVVSEWKSVFERYRQYRREFESAAQSDEEAQAAGDLNVLFDLDVKSLQVSDLDLADMRVSGEHRGDHWQLDMNNQTLTGNLFLYDDDTRPMVLTLDYLRLPGKGALSGLGAQDSRTPGLAPPSEESAVATGDVDISGGETGDPFSDWNPAETPAMDFSTKEFSIGEQNFGNWTFSLRPTEHGLIVRDLKADVNGAQLLGIEADQGAELRWERRDGEAVSQLRGRLKAKDLADVMKAWGQPKLLESKNAVFDIELSWPGSPAAASVKALSGSLHMNVRKGRFFSDSSSGANPILRLIGLFNFDTWARRLELDFSDLFKGGMAYDKISGQMQFDGGSIYLTKPVKVETPSSLLQMAGTIDMREELLDATLVATLPVGGNLTLLTALAAGLPAAASVYVASKIFKKQVDKVASASYRMTGPWSDPVVAFERLFDDKAAKRAGEDTLKEVEANGKANGKTNDKHLNNDKNHDKVNKIQTESENPAPMQSPSGEQGVGTDGVGTGTDNDYNFPQSRAGEITSEQ